MPSRTRTGRCGTPRLCRSRTIRGSATSESDRITRSTAADVTAACGWLLWAIRAPEQRNASTSRSDRGPRPCTRIDAARPPDCRHPRVATPAPTGCGDEIGQLVIVERPAAGGLALQVGDQCRRAHGLAAARPAPPTSGTGARTVRPRATDSFTAGRPVSPVAPEIRTVLAVAEASPVCLNNQPPCPSIAARNTSSCAVSATRIPSASASHRRVEPSTSVNRNVTTPEGAATSAESHNRCAPKSHIGGNYRAEHRTPNRYRNSRSARLRRCVSPDHG